MAVIREVGGVMVPLWSQYFEDVKRMLYVVDASNLCQISAAGVLLYTLLAEPKLQNTKVRQRAVNHFTRPKYTEEGNSAYV